jgi:MFS family permease
MMREPLSLAAAGLVLAVYIAVLSAMPKGSFWSPDEGAKFIQLESIRWSAGVHYDIPYAGQTIDPDFAFYPTHCGTQDLYPLRMDDGAVRFHWPIWFPLMSWLPVSLIGLTGLYVLPLLSGWLTALAAGHLMRAWNERLVPLAIVLVGLATPICFFSLTYWEHTLAAVLGLAALCLIAREGPSRDSRLGWTALLLLGAVILRIEMLLFAFALMLSWGLAGRIAPGNANHGSDHQGAERSQRRRAAITGVAAAAIAAAVLIGESITWRHRGLIGALPDYLLDDLRKLPHLLGALAAAFVDSPGNQAPVIPRLWRGLASAAFGASAVSVFVGSAWLEALILLPALLFALDFSLYLAFREPYVSLHGFLPVAPFLLFAVYALPPVLRRRRYAQLILVGVAVLYAVMGFGAILTFKVGLDSVYSTGLEWGNRDLFTLYPIATVLTLAGVYEYRASSRPLLLKRVVSIFVALLMLAGLLLEMRGVWSLCESRKLVATWEAALAGSGPIITDVWWLPADMAPFFATNPMSCVRQPSDLAPWLKAALEHGVERFTFASFREVDAARFGTDEVIVAPEAQHLVAGLYVSRFRIAPAGEPYRAATSPMADTAQ